MARCRYSPPVPAPEYPFWRQLVGFLLAAVLALTIPGSATFAHVDALFGPHLHDTLTQRVIPLVDPHGHPSDVHGSSTEVEVGDSQSDFGAPSLLPRDVLASEWLTLMTLACIAVVALWALQARLSSPLVAPIPPPPGFSRGRHLPLSIAY